jgi:hypothetical protein
MKTNDSLSDVNMNLCVLNYVDYNIHNYEKRTGMVRK